MSKAEDRAKETYPLRDAEHVYDEERVIEAREYFVEGYHQAEEDLIDKTLDFLKDKLYENGYVGIIDLCDDYIKAMKDEYDRKSS